MLYWTAVLLLVALGAAVLGFTGLAGAMAWLAKIIFYIALVLVVISLLARRAPPPTA